MKQYLKRMKEIVGPNLEGTVTTFEEMTSVVNGRVKKKGRKFWL